MVEEISSIVASSQKVVVVQADNPDADSLGSALALEHILGDMGKNVVLYCGVDIPGYLRYLAGWDRVVKDLPTQFDASIIVDASTTTLLEKLQESNTLGWLTHKPCIVLDHHAIVEHRIDFAQVSLCDADVSSTGELLYRLAKDAGWQVSPGAGQNIMAAILGDTQGLTNDLTASSTYTVMAELTTLGVNRPALEDMRREFSKMPAQIYNYKADLIRRTAFAADGRIAHVTVPQTEITTFSPLYNPGPLIQTDMLQVTGVQVAIVFKHYADGKTTAAIRATHGYPIAGKLAEQMGGGGHPYASGFKITDGQSFEDVRTNCLRIAAELIDTIAED